MSFDFYVYAHRRSSDDRIFYVGKGRGKRHLRTGGRGDWWSRIAKKHGHYSEIIYAKLSEPMALRLEKCLIADIGRDKLCNLTDGGDGLCGHIPSDQTRQKLSAAQTGRKYHEDLRARMNLSLKKKTHCSNGMSFGGASDAARWLLDNGFPKARQSVISRCADGLRSTAYGLAWSYKEIPPIPNLVELKTRTREKQSAAKIGKAANNVISIICGNGMKFDSAKLAEKWLKVNGHPKASSSAICSAAKGKRNTAYGFQWFYA
jgi:ribosomal protein L25 (general stress protein Ctc)